MPANNDKENPFTDHNKHSKTELQNKYVGLIK